MAPADDGVSLKPALRKQASGMGADVIERENLAVVLHQHDGSIGDCGTSGSIGRELCFRQRRSERAAPHPGAEDFEPYAVERSGGCVKFRRRAQAAVTREKYRQAARDRRPRLGR